MKIICTNCEAENDANAKYCSICGFKLPVIENPEQTTELKNLNEKKPKKKFDIKTLIGFLIGFGVMFYVTQYLLSPSVDKQLVKVANEMNKSCPMNIDEFTILKNVIALPNKTIQYNYTLVGIKKSDVKIDTLKKYFFPTVLQNAKTNPGMKMFRDNKVTINYYYDDKDGKFVTEYIVKPEMYQ